MKILLDHCTPAPLRRYLSEHSVDTAHELGWHTLRNGALLDIAEQHGYEILVTTDQSIRHQQNWADRDIGLLLLLSNSWPRIQLHIGPIQNELNGMRPGEFKELSIPSFSDYHQDR